jgi:hypothetical protein
MAQGRPEPLDERAGPAADHAWGHLGIRAPGRRPKGRSLADFTANDTVGRLLPAEQRLFDACCKGEKCEFDRDTGQAMHAVSHAAQDREIYRLACDMVVSGDAGSEELQARLAAHPFIVQDLLKDIQRCALSALDRQQRERLPKQAEVLRPLFERTTESYQREVRGWRSVNLANADARVRADFLRFLALGGDETAPVHENGVQVVGAVIDGLLNLGSVAVPSPLFLYSCRIDDGILLTGATTRDVDLNGSRVERLHAVSARIQGSLFLCDGFRAERGVHLDLAKIDGRLQASGCTLLRNPDGDALLADGAEVGGDMVLGIGFRAEGQVRLVGARITGQFLATGGQFHNPGGDALLADSAEIGGDTKLDGDFQAVGQVRLVGARIGGDLMLQGGVFRNARPVPDDDPVRRRRRAVEALDIRNARVERQLWLGPRTPKARQVTFGGSLDLQGAYANIFALDPLSLPLEQVCSSEGTIGALDCQQQAGVPLDAVPQNDRRTKLDCTVSLNGFKYDHIEFLGTTDVIVAAAKLLQRQPPAHAEIDFRPQPYEQLINTFLALGRDDEARAIAKLKGVAKHRRNAVRHWQTVRPKLWRRPNGALGRRLGIMSWTFVPLTTAGQLICWSMRRLLLFGNWLAMDWFLGQGYDRTKALAAFVLLTIIGAWIYGESARQGLFMPADKMFTQDSEVRRLCAGTPEAPPPSEHLNWVACKAHPDGYVPFHALAYSLDLMVPFGSLGPRRDWRVDETRHAQLVIWRFAPIGISGRTVLWISVVQTYAAIGLYTLLLAFLTGVIKRQ